MSQDLKERGFRFVGPTICYAFMQAVGMVDDHAKRLFSGYTIEGILRAMTSLRMTEV